MRQIRTVIVAALALGLMGAGSPIRMMRPSFAGMWYPDDPAALKASVEKCVQDAKTVETGGRCVALIVPHVPYSTFGTIPGAAFKLIQPGQFDRVIVLAPAHFSELPEACSIPSVQVWRTPLGDIPLDGPAIRDLDRSSFIDVRSVRYSTLVPQLTPKNKKKKKKKPALVMVQDTRQQLHEREYTTEVILPFLQVRLGDFKLIPIIVGDLEKSAGHPDELLLDSLAETLRPVLSERTLLVVSSDLTHYGERFRYRPFTENVVENIDALDREALRLIVEKDAAGFDAYLRQTENPICGKDAIRLLLKLLPRSARGVLLDHEIAARKSGDTTTSISYASVAFVMPEHAAVETGK